MILKFKSTNDYFLSILYKKLGVNNGIALVENKNGYISHATSVPWKKLRRNSNLVSDTPRISQVYCLGWHCQYSFSVCLSVVAKISDNFSLR